MIVPAPGGSRSGKWRRDLRQDLRFEGALVRRSRFHADAGAAALNFSEVVPVPKNGGREVRGEFVKLDKMHLHSGKFSRSMHAVPNTCRRAILGNCERCGVY